LLNNTISLTIVIHFKSDYIGIVRARLPLYFCVHNKRTVKPNIYNVVTIIALKCNEQRTMKLRKCQKLEMMQLYSSAIIVNTKHKFLINANESNHHEWKMLRNEYKF